MNSRATDALGTNGSIATAPFTTSGFNLDAGPEINNRAGDTNVSWTFRKAAKFFDVVTYTGNGADPRTISHNLGSVPGSIIVKRTDSADDWIVYHRSVTTGYLKLNTTAATLTRTDYIYQNPTSTTFQVGGVAPVNASGGTYVAYLFAHDAGGFGTAGTDSVSACGTYTGNGSATGPTVTLNWEPQWLLIKRTNSTGDWQLIDNMRGFVVGGADAELNPNLSAAESTGTFVTPLATGFQLNTTNVGYNASGGTYIYIAIRRGPMKTPTVGTQVLNAVTYTGTGVNDRNVASGFSTDLFAVTDRNAGASEWTSFVDRLRGRGVELRTTSTGSEVAFDYFARFDVQNGVNVYNVNQYNNISDKISYHFRRAPGFFDVVICKQTGSAQNVNHNLGVAPELLILKDRTSAVSWQVGTQFTSTTWNNLVLNSSSAGSVGAYNNYINAQPTSSVFRLGPYLGSVNDSFVAYLFATAPGVSKVGTYTGTGTTKQIDCGFTAGARLVLIKRTDSTGSWYVWDTARGIVSGNDSYLLLNSTAAEVTNTDYIDPLSSGFEISSTAPAEINANGGSYIFLAVA